MCIRDRRISLRAIGHVDPAHPLRSNGRLHALHLCEYGAQAMAVHGGLRGAATVSYTHLDVYKRQVQVCVEGEAPRWRFRVLRDDSVVASGEVVAESPAAG